MNDELELLTDSERFFLDLERSGAYVTNMGSLWILGGTPSWDGFVQAVGDIVAIVPRLRQRVVHVPYRGPAWTVDPHFSVANHVDRVELSPGAGFAEAVGHATRLYSLPFDRQRPAWQFTLVAPMADGRSAVYVRLDHAMSDAIGLIRTLAAARPVDPTEARLDGTVADAVADAVAARARRAWATARTLAATGRRLAADPEYRHSAGRQVRSHADYLRRLAGGRDRRGGSPSAHRDLISARMPLDDFRRAAKDRGGSVNDLFVAMGVEVVHRVFAEAGVALSPVRVTIPIDVRAADDEGLGNKFVRGLAHVHRTPSMLDDLTEVAAVLDDALQLDNVPVSPLVAELHALLPRPVRTAFGRWAGTYADVVTSNTRFPVANMTIEDVPVEEIYGYGPAIGAPASFLLVNYLDHLHLSMTAHPGLLPDVGRAKDAFRHVVSSVVAPTRMA